MDSALPTDSKSHPTPILLYLDKHNKGAQELVALLELPENALVFDVETGKRVQLTPESLQVLHDSLGGAIRSRKRKTREDTAEPTSDEAELDIPDELANQPFHPSIPTTDVPDIFIDNFVDDEDLLQNKFTIHTFGYVYGLKRAPDLTYRLIFAAAFLDFKDFTSHDLARIRLMYRWLLLAREQAYLVVNNASQNGDNFRGRGELSIP